MARAVKLTIDPPADAVATRKTQGAAGCCSGSQSPARLALAGPSDAAASLPGLTWQADAPAHLPQTRVERGGPGARHGHAWVAGRQPRTLLAEGRRAGKPVTERDLSVRAPAQRAAWRQVASADMVYEPRPNGLILFRRRVPILTVGSHVQPRQQGSHGGVGRAARKAMAKASDNGPLSLSLACSIEAAVQAAPIVLSARSAAPFLGYRSRGKMGVTPAPGLWQLDVREPDCVDGLGGCYGSADWG